MGGGGGGDTKAILGNIGNDDFDFGQQGNKAIEPEHDKTNKRHMRTAKTQIS